MKEIDLLSTHVTHINEKKVQGQTLRSELIWILFLNKHGNNEFGVKPKLLTADLRSGPPEND
jgi:hypothetical protein